MDLSFTGESGTLGRVSSGYNPCVVNHFVHSWYGFSSWIAKEMVGFGRDSRLLDLQNCK